MKSSPREIESSRFVSLCKRALWGRKRQQGPRDTTRSEDENGRRNGAGEDENGATCAASSAVAVRRSTLSVVAVYIRIIDRGQRASSF